MNVIMPKEAGLAKELGSGLEEHVALAAIASLLDGDVNRRLNHLTPEAWTELMELAITLVCLIEPAERQRLIADLRARIAVHAIRGETPLLEACGALLFAAVRQAAGDAMAADDAASLATALRHVLSLEVSEIYDVAAFQEVVQDGLQWFWMDLDRPADILRDAVGDAIIRWAAVDQPMLALMGSLGDFFNFSVFRFEPSPVRQCELAMAPMAALGEAMRRSALPGRPTAQPLPGRGGVIHVGYLAMGADPKDALTIPLAHIAPILTALPGRFRFSVFAWGNIDANFLDSLRAMGAECHEVSWRTLSSFEEHIVQIERLLRNDPVSVLISDLNYSLPTALFARRAAPVQVFLQGGMAVWPVPNLDAVYNSWGSDPVQAGWGEARVEYFATPWDLNALNPPVRPDEVARESASMPRGFRLIGTYCRLMKITEPFLRAVERILLACPDVAFVVGGTGDNPSIRAFIAGSPVGARMCVVERYVSGHSWGRLLELFLDTWPLTGGESVREALTKGCPVVALHSDEMPALDLQRDPALLAMDWDGFVTHAVGLLQSADEMLTARRRAVEFAGRWADPTTFRDFLVNSIEMLVDERRPTVRAEQAAALLSLRDAKLEVAAARLKQEQQEAAEALHRAVHEEEPRDAPPNPTVCPEPDARSREFELQDEAQSLLREQDRMAAEIGLLQQEMNWLTRELDRTRGSMRSFLPHYLPRLGQHVRKRLWRGGPRADLG